MNMHKQRHGDNERLIDAIFILRDWIDKQIEFEERQGDEYKKMETKLKKPHINSTVHYQKSVTLQKVMNEMIRLGLWEGDK